MSGANSGPDGSIPSKKSSCDFSLPQELSFRTDPEVVWSSPRYRMLRHEVPVPGKQPVVMDTLDHPGAVVILPLLEDGSVVLITHERVAVGRPLWELPAGTREVGEDPIQTAGRELKEETGYVAGVLEPMREYFVSPGFSNERMFLFRATQLTPGPQALEPGERIQVVSVAWTDALRLVDSGAIEDGKTLVALLHHDRWLRTTTGEH